MKTLATLLVAAEVVLLSGCYTRPKWVRIIAFQNTGEKGSVEPISSGGGRDGPETHIVRATKDADADLIAVKLAVLADMVVEADKTAGFVRFVDLRPPELERLRRLCGPRFQICSAADSEKNSGVLRLKGSGQEGVYLEVGGEIVQDREAEAYGDYVHVGSFARFHYTLRYTDGAWRISSCKFDMAS